jgi:hypothetical protein
MNGFALWAANLGDWLIPLIIILFVIISAASQALGKLREADRQRQRRGLARPPAGGEPVRDEIGEFLRRAKRGPAAGRPQPAARPGGRPARSGRQPTPQGLAEVELVEPEDTGVAGRGGRGLPSESVPTLVSDVAEADDRLEQHLHGTFDHRLGTLGASPGESAEGPQPAEAETPADRVSSVPATAAVGLAAMLAGPTSLRQAILLYEVLRRPEDRWQ